MAKKTAKKKTATKKKAAKKKTAKKPQLKTRRTSADVDRFFETVADAGRRADCEAVTAMMKKATGAEPRMWGKAIVGFGDIHMRYESGRELDWFLVGFSPRKANLTLYVMPYDEGGYADLRRKLGKHKTGKSCLYLKSLDDVDTKVLAKLIDRSVKDTKKRWS